MSSKTITSNSNINLTLSLDRKLVLKGREYAFRQGLSLNDLIRRFLKNKVACQSDQNWLKGTFALMDKAKGFSKKKWQREELYEK